MYLENVPTPKGTIPNCLDRVCVYMYLVRLRVVPGSVACGVLRIHVQHRQIGHL